MSQQRVKNPDVTVARIRALENQIFQLQSERKLQAKKDLIWKSQVEEWFLKNSSFDLRLQVELKLLENDCSENVVSTSNARSVYRQNGTATPTLHGGMAKAFTPSPIVSRMSPTVTITTVPINPVPGANEESTHNIYDPMQQFHNSTISTSQSVSLTHTPNPKPNILHGRKRTHAQAEATARGSIDESELTTPIIVSTSSISQPGAGADLRQKSKTPELILLDDDDDDTESPPPANVQKLQTTQNNQSQNTQHNSNYTNVTNAPNRPPATISTNSPTAFSSSYSSPSNTSLSSLSAFLEGTLATTSTIVGQVHQLPPTSFEQSHQFNNSITSVPSAHEQTTGAGINATAATAMSSNNSCYGFVYEGGETCQMSQGIINLRTLEQPFIDANYISRDHDQLAYNIQKILLDYDPALHSDLLRSREDIEKYNVIPQIIKKRTSSTISEFLIHVYADNVPKDAKEAMAQCLFEAYPCTPKETWYHKQVGKNASGHLEHRINHLRRQLREQRKQNDGLGNVLLPPPPPL